MSGFCFYPILWESGLEGELVQGGRFQDGGVVGGRLGGGDEFAAFVERTFSPAVLLKKSPWAAIGYFYNGDSTGCNGIRDKNPVANRDVTKTSTQNPVFRQSC